MTSDINYSDILKEKWHKKKICLLVLQGSSCSGKTTIANFINDKLKNQYKVDVISTDNYYKDFPYDLTAETLSKYDFDNPAALDWELLEKTLFEYALESKTITKYSYDFNTKKKTAVVVKNMRPQILIIEGIYSFNLFNQKKFNIPEFDCLKTRKEHNFTEEFIMNNSDISSYFEILFVQLKLPKELMKKIRINRDVEHRYKNTTKEFLRVLEARFEKLIWPSTVAWVYNQHNRPDILIEGGSFNEKNCCSLCKGIFEFLLLEDKNGGDFVSSIMNKIYVSK
ncbi:hypothetical protein NUSPORA_00323 [Nucleospora cyclopteri]